MKKNITILMIIFLISFTTIIKNTSKKLENDIFNKRENIILLERKYSLILLENNYLSSLNLTFISHPLSKMGEASVKMLKDIENGANPEDTSKLIEPILNKGKSDGKIKS